MMDKGFFIAKKGKAKKRAYRMQAAAEAKNYNCETCGRKRGKIHKEKNQYYIYCPQCEDPNKELKAFESNNESLSYTVKDSRPNKGVLARITSKLGLSRK